jgi:hypothetical protein
MEEKEITQEMIDGLKKQYGDIYKVTLGGQDYIYRPLKRVEYKGVISNPDATRSYSEEQIVQKCVVYPTMDSGAISAGKAGTVSTLTELVMEVSDFGIKEEPIKL